MPNDLVTIFNGTYRGIVKDNSDPEVKGRCKIFMPSIYPATFEKTPTALPWAEPVMPLFGGNYMNARPGDLNAEVGITTIPHVGSEVWVFFENADHNYPKYFAACQAGAGWLSEHNNQHVIKTDNVRIRIDENTDDPNSTTKFTTYNSECTQDSIDEHTKENQPTRVDIEIWKQPGASLNVKILGDVNMFISGDVYEDIRGNKHETLSGDLFRHHVGNSHIVQQGDIHFEHTGDLTHDHIGDRIYTQIGDETEIQVTGNKYHFQLGEKARLQIGNNVDIQFKGARSFTQVEEVEGEPTPVYNETLGLGNKTEYVAAIEGETVLGSASKTVGTLYTQTAGAQISRTAPMVVDNGAIIDHKAVI